MNISLTTDIAHGTLATKRGSQPSGRLPVPANPDQEGFSAMLGNLETESVATDLASSLSDASSTNRSTENQKDDSRSEHADETDGLSGLSGPGEMAPFLPVIRNFPEKAADHKPALNGEVPLADIGRVDNISLKPHPRSTPMDQAGRLADLPHATRLSRLAAENPGTVSATDNRVDEGHRLLRSAPSANAAPRNETPSGKLSAFQGNGRARELRISNIGGDSPQIDKPAEPAMSRVDGLAGVAGALRMGRDGQADLLTSVPTAIHGAPASQSSWTLVTPAATIHIAPTAANPQWAEALGSAVMRMTAEKLGEATLTVSPAELGNISVKIDLQGSQVSVNFLVGTAEVHRAVEASLPRLQEMMAQSGLSLGQSSVGQEQPKPFFQGPAQLPLPRNLSARETPEEAQIAAVLPRRAAIGRVDMFA